MNSEIIRNEIAAKRVKKKVKKHVFKMAGAVNVRAHFFLFIVIVVLQSAYASMPEYTPAITRTLSARYALIKSYFHQGYA